MRYRAALFFAPLLIGVALLAPVRSEETTPERALAKEVLPALKAIIAALEKYLATTEPTPEPVPMPQPEPTPVEPDPEPEPQPQPKPDPQPEPQPVPQPEPTPKPDPKPAPQPTPDPAPTKTPAFPEVIGPHPRLYWHGDVRARLTASLDTWKEMVRIADVLTKIDPATGKPLKDTDPIPSGRWVDAPLCGAVIWMLAKEGGLPAAPMVPAGKLMVPAFKYGLTPEQYRDGAIAQALVIADSPINLAGNHYAVNHLHPLAVLYDWLYDDMTDEQRAKIRATLVESLNAAWTKERYALKLDAAGNAVLDADGNPIKVKVPVQNPNLYVEGYNADCGIGMTVALAVHGETDVDWVRRYWFENWWAIPPPEAKGKGGFWNRQYERDWLVGGGNNEDWGYLGNQIGIRAARHAWQTATGDVTSLDYPWLNRNPFLYLHQSLMDGRRRWILPSCCSGGGYTGLGHHYWFAAGTGSSDPTTAALAAWMLGQMDYSKPCAFDEVFWRCIVGDPRVAAKSPAELGLPFDYTTESTGFHWDRNSWDDTQATRVFFGCSEQPYRATAVGDVMVMVKGLPLVGHRNASFDHSYAGLGRLTLPQIREVATGKLLPAQSGDATPIRLKFASFTRDGDTYTADLSRLWSPKIVTSYTRSFRYDRDANVVTITDSTVCAPGYVPTATYGTPETPLVTDDRVVFSSSVATGVMTFDRQPAEITVRGGKPTDEDIKRAADLTYTPTYTWCEDYDRTKYNVAASRNWLKNKCPPLTGGCFTVYVTPQQIDGVYRLTSTLQVK